MKYVIDSEKIAERAMEHFGDDGHAEFGGVHMILGDYSVDGENRRLS